MELSVFSFERSRTDRVIAGVAGGLGARLGVEPAVVRLATLVLALAGGVGVVAYVALWVSSSDEPAEHREPPVSMRRFFATWFVVLGCLLIVREFSFLWPGDTAMGSVALGGFGSALLWSRGEDSTGGRFRGRASRLPTAPGDVLGGSSRARVAAGAILVIAGMMTFLAISTSFEALRTGVVAVAVTVVGLGLIFGPWVDRLVRQVRAERHERVRSQERAEVAAHLHDSVLQTLALIQRARTPEEMTSLARLQERDLRAWLQGRTVTGAPTTMSEALDELANRIERLHRVAVDSVLVGDMEMDDRARALLDAAGEAVTNAARHAGVRSISLYCEVDDAEVSLYVRDTGRGFESSPVPNDRRGIAESIIGRMERNGGVATVESTVGEGTEVHLVLPRRTS